MNNSSEVITPGMILNRRYHVIKQIGSGGMAKVFEVYDDILKINLALKVMKIKEKDNNENISRFYKEYEAIAQVFHPNIVRIYGIFEEFNRQCLVLELVKGCTLKQKILNYGPCTINEVIYYLISINNAVIEAHENDIIHRDIKPENILLSNDGQVKIADFGVSILENLGVQEKNKIVGTSRYMAPEIIQSEVPTKQSDVYALGIMLYELLLGITPYSAKTPALLAVKHVREIIINPKEVLPGINQKLENIILKATAKNKNERYHSVLEFNEELKTLHQSTLFYKPIINDEKPLYLKNVIKIKGKKQKIVNKNLVFSFLLQKKTLYCFSFFLVIILIIFLILFWI